MASTFDGSAHSETVPSAPAATTRPAPSQATDVTGCGCGSVAVIFRVLMLHTSTLATDVPAASDWPSGLNATVFAQLVAPVSAPSGTARSAATRHSQTLKSLLDAASSCPSGLNATPETEAPGPRNGIPASGTGAPSADRCHSQTVPTSVPAASVRPSGLNATEFGYVPRMTSGAPSGVACAGSATCHSRTVPSALAA